MRVTFDWAPGGVRRVLLNIPIPKGAAEMAFGFLLKSGGGGSMDPMAEVDKAVTEERMSDALDLLGDLLAATREESKRQAIQARIAALRESESTDWQAVQAQRFVAELVGLKPYFETSIQKLDQYEKRWPRSKRLDAAKAERAKLATGLAAAAEDRETLRAHRLLDRAEEHLKEGQKQMARELCDTVRKHYAQSASAATRAADLLKKIGTE
jgi:type I site-specific restriction endonuclease